MNLGRGYDVYVRTPHRDHEKKEVGFMWTLRTNGHRTTDLEMAQALTHDLTRMGVKWQIRNRLGAVVEESEGGTQ